MWLPGGACVVARVYMVAGGGCAWLLGGHVWLLGGHVWLPRRCVVAGGHAWLLGWGAYMVAGGHAWLPGGMHGEGEGMHGEGVCVAKGGMCGEGEHVWQRGGVWDTTRYGDTINERAVRILLECILVLIKNCYLLRNEKFVAIIMEGLPLH